MEDPFLPTSGGHLNLSPGQPYAEIGGSRLSWRAGGWDAGLRVTAGCLLVGTFQALVLGRMVAIQQHASGRTYYRIGGSRILTGTRLGHTASDADTSRSASASPPRSFG